MRLKKLVVLIAWRVGHEARYSSPVFSVATNDSAEGVVVVGSACRVGLAFKKLVQVLDSAALTGGSSLVIVTHKLLKQYRQEDGLVHGTVARVVTARSASPR
jgi:hypothetical protein